MLQILGMSYVGWVHAWWSTISIWCVYEFGYGCVCFLWVCGILAHNSCSSQVTAQFSRTYLAFLPRHDYHTPSTPVLAMWNISIIPEWNWSQVSEMNSSPQHPFTHSSLSHPCTLFPFWRTVSRSYYSPPAQIPAVLQLESSGPNPLPPESAVCVCRRDRVIWQRHLFGDLLLG